MSEPKVRIMQGTGKRGKRISETDHEDVAQRRAKKSTRKNVTIPR